MALVPASCQDLIQVLPTQHHQNLIEVYNRIPGSLLNFLQKQDVVKVISFDDTISVSGNLGPEKKKTWDTFRMNLRSSVQQKLNQYNVKEIKAEELSDYISNEYLKKCPMWAKPGENLSAIVQLNKSFVDECSRKINAYMYARITEECENNWLSTDYYKYSYYLSLELKGIVIDKTRALEFCELVSRDVQLAIEQIQTQTQLTWGSFVRNR
ncbi:unnamed protein product [Rotaria sp. Silwood1]|nr:unnamed protein product [Rotaria sp. Silwood1]CAF1192640.1 unnamed protein product [Rotaria sp. Silwood1]CAF3455262.1 unnamed protein product [Rotaria sp. Silwood1]CAF3467110.1 unnamed protein product [Rotaria sp. Silwood1]CAF3488966.1 unnamed protein product [Rotaria sp. Silwood1]